MKPGNSSDFCLMMRFQTVLYFALSLWACTSQESRFEKHVTFRVIPRNVPDSAGIYLAGNHPQLGNWRPDGILLEKQADGSWQKTFIFPAGTRLEYKFTRGAWQNEAVSAEGVVPPNSILEVRNDTILTIAIASWRDVSSPVAGRITGKVEYHRRMPGEGIKPRDVIVWLPPSYATSPAQRYPVLYLHDGQNVFDPNTSFLGVDWQIDEAADSLMRAGKMKEIIVVAIYNTEDRTAEYSDSELGRAYMRFLVEKLKPFIDAHYRTKFEREHTATMGSSMGGLISFLLVWNYPNTFSQAACLSPAFVQRFESAIRMVEEYDGLPKKIRIYLDNGGLDVDSLLQAGCEKMLAALEQKGFTRGENLEWFHDPQAEHSERAWARRVWRPLLFMFHEPGV